MQYVWDMSCITQKIISSWCDKKSNITVRYALIDVHYRHGVDAPLHTSDLKGFEIYIESLAIISFLNGVIGQ